LISLFFWRWGKHPSIRGVKPSTEQLRVSNVQSAEKKPHGIGGISAAGLPRRGGTKRYGFTMSASRG
jgi:hypothetical protein